MWSLRRKVNEEDAGKGGRCSHKLSRQRARRSKGELVNLVVFLDILLRSRQSTIEMSLN